MVRSGGQRGGGRCKVHEVRIFCSWSGEQRRGEKGWEEEVGKGGGWCNRALAAMGAWRGEEWWDGMGWKLLACAEDC